MARFDAWVTLQRQLVDNGAAVEKIVLEGPDGTSWGQWPIGFPELIQSIEGILGSLRDQLSPGRHGVRLLALAADGSQISVFPHTIQGSGQAAGDVAQSHVTVQRAMALFISNAEKMQSVAAQALRASEEREERSVLQNAQLLDRLARIEDSSQASRIAEQREAQKQARFDQMTQSLAPLLSVGAEFMAAFAADWLQQRQASRNGAPTSDPPQVDGGKVASPGALPVAPAEGVAESTPNVGPIPAAIGEQSAESRDTRTDTPSRAVQIAREGCPDRNRGGLSRRAGRNSKGK